ncbi:MAG: ExbD/TolR family protein [Pirellulaceae bacterium]
MPLKTHADEEPSLNLTSMIDVLFLLIIFFMTGTKFTELERSIGLKVPQVSDARHLPAAPDQVAINVYRDGTVTLDREPVTLEQLAEKMMLWSRQNPAFRVTVRGDAEGAFQNVAQVLATCRQAGVRDMGITVGVKR